MNDQEYEATWQRFVAEGRVKGYAPPYRSSEMVEQGYEHAVLLIHITAQEWVAELERMQAALQHIPWVRLQARGFFHATIRNIGDIVPGKPQVGNQFAAADFEDMQVAISHAVESCPPFTLRLGGLNSWSGIAFAEIYDDGAIDTVRSAIAASYPLPNESYHFSPHITVASYIEDTDATPLIEAITPLRQPVGLTLTVTTLSLERTRFGPPGHPPQVFATRRLILRGE